jgi:hypothetical protein
MTQAFDAFREDFAKDFPTDPTDEFLVTPWKVKSNKSDNIDGRKLRKS